MLSLGPKQVCSRSAGSDARVLLRLVPTGVAVCSAGSFFTLLGAERRDVAPKAQRFAPDAHRIAPKCTGFGATAEVYGLNRKCWGLKRR